MNKIILIAGGSASGKTYVANSVLNTLKSEDIIRLTIDDFYKDNSHLPLEERRKINFDHPKSIDFKLLYEVLSSLKEGKEVDIPTYDSTSVLARNYFEAEREKEKYENNKLRLKLKLSLQEDLC